MIASATRSTTLHYPSDRSELPGESGAGTPRLYQRNSAAVATTVANHKRQWVWLFRVVVLTTALICPLPV
jgi:hypothetical protein